MTNEQWLAFVPQGAIHIASSPAVSIGDRDFVCVGSGTTRARALADAGPYAHVQLYENQRHQWVPKADSGDDGAGWIGHRG
jgi:hypothetical protein